MKIKVGVIMKEYIVTLKDKLIIGTYDEQNQIDEFTLPAPEERFPYGELNIEVYKRGSYEDCQKFIDDIKDKKIRDQFKIIDTDDLQKYK